MTIDDSFRSSADMVREAAADDAQQEWADYCEQRLLESPETAAALWAHTLQQQAKEQPAVIYREDKPGIDTRLFGP